MERIHVSVRARPLSTEDAKTSPWKISSDSIFMPNHPSPAFEFDRIFREDCKTVQVYEARTKEIVAAAVRGFNGTVFAYGQTNSGKTHTMRGSSSEPGVIPLAVHDLFDTLDQDASREFLLRMSYLEIYNEDINDLLAPEHRKLQIHENLEKGIFVAGLREEIVASPQQVLEMMEFGESHRHIGETNMNLYSSRSHTIFRMIIESRQKMQDEGVGNACDAVRVSVLNLVDLAGSERASKTGAEGVRLKEGSHINKSLMTLGTVIKKLSEGVESQGGHVPYRDSKLTRILQPALGGNANTAIICNITLAPIHADETKSSLQFASRALRVTNCAHVNEILTDAALLKRQKKEIEELRSKLKASHSDHSEEEILNLRNTLLKSELERERIALELEEEKKAQAQRERVLQEQAKKIKNLSSMVLLSNRDEKRETGHLKKGKRRDTWCPGNLSRDSTPEVESNVLSRGSSLKSVRPEREIGPLLPFAELDEVKFLDNISEQDEDSINETLEDSALPDPHALMHVTSRKKPSASQRSPIVVGNELDRIQREYEDLLLQYETEIISNEIQIECFKRKLGEDDLSGEAKCKQLECGVVGNVHSDETSVNLSDPKDILLIKQLQEKINMLEMEKSSSQQNLDDLVTVATEQNVCAREKIAEIQEEIYAAREEARAAGEEAQVAREQLVSKESEVINLQEEIYAAKEETKVAREETKVAREEDQVACEQLVSKHQEEIYAAREETKAAKEEAQVAREQLVSKESEVINLQEEIYAAREETKAAREEAQVACEQLVSKESEVNNLQEEIYAAREETKAAREEAQVTREQLVSKESEVINLQEEIYASREETKAAREEAQVVREQLVSKESEVNNLQEEIYASREETRAAKEEAQVTREQLVSKESKVINLHEEIYAAREETKAAREEAQVTREQLVSKESEVINVRKLQEEIYAAREEARAAREEARAAGEETKAAKEEAQVVREQLASKESEVNNLQEEVYAAREETKAAREEAQVVREQLVSKESEVINVSNENFNSLVNIGTDFEDLVSEFEDSRASVATISSVMDEVLEDFAFFSPLLQDFTLFMRQSFEQHASLISSYQNAQSCLKQKVLDIEDEKLLLQEQCAGLQSQIDELNEEDQKHKTSLMNLSERHESEMSDLLSHIEGLEKNIASLSSSSLAKEKENLRKDFEKTKTKLKDTESKLKNVMQDKTKLEAEKASAERELKRLHSQKALLERDISKQESFAGKRHDSLIVERSANQSLQEEYKNLEVLAIEMESTIASLEEELAVERGEKEEALSRNDGLYSEITSLTEKLEHSNSHLEHLQKDVMELKTRLEESSSDQQQLETSVKKLLEEKEELAMHLANSLLEMEEEKAIWSSKEQASTDAMEEKIRLYSIQIESISKEMSEAKKELESCRLECVTLADRLRCCEENVNQEKERSMEKSLEIDRLGDELRSAQAVSKQSQEDADADSIEKAKLKMRLRGTQARYDAISLRHKQSMNELEVMNRKFEEASAKLKEKLASKALEVLDLKKQISVLSRTM